MADKDKRIKKLEKYIPLEETEVGSKFPSRSTKSVAAMDAADLAEGVNPKASNKELVDAFTTGRDMGWSEEGQTTKEKAINRKLDKASELADQYKRETRGVKNDSLLGKIREAIGMKKGGKVKTASSRGDGIAQRGKTRA
tara:strand:- start:973 stop:1392 length:420 start_codon:yes stop_codon:yes gene_type:complete